MLGFFCVCVKFNGRVLWGSGGRRKWIGTVGAYVGGGHAELLKSLRCALAKMYSDCSKALRTRKI